MRRWLVVLGLALMLCLVVLPQTKVRSADQTVRAEDELVRLVREWLNAEARNDRAALDRLVADDFIGTPFGGNIVTKADILPPEVSGDRGWAKVLSAGIDRENLRRHWAGDGPRSGRRSQPTRWIQIYDRLCQAAARLADGGGAPGPDCPAAIGQATASNPPLWIKPRGQRRPV